MASSSSGPRLALRPFARAGAGDPVCRLVTAARLVFDAGRQCAFSATWWGGGIATLLHVRCTAVVRKLPELAVGVSLDRRPRRPVDHVASAGLAGIQTGDRQRCADGRLRFYSSRTLAIFRRSETNAARWALASSLSRMRRRYDGWMVTRTDVPSVAFRICPRSSIRPTLRPIRA